jgi:hypothetical protein
VKSRRTRLVGAAALALAAMGYVAASCSEPEVASPSSSTGAGGKQPDWSTTPGPAVTSAASGTSATSGTSGGPCQPAPAEPDGLWRMPSDGCFKHVAWPDAGCNVEVAIDPVLAAPPLVWIPCPGGTPACDVQKITWWTKIAQPLASVMRWGEGYRWGILLVLPHDDTSDLLATVYDENAKPLVVWRVAYGPGCVLKRPLVTPSRVWMGVSSSAAKQIFNIAPPWGSEAAASVPIPYSSRDQYWTSQGDWMVSHLNDGATLEIANLATQTDIMLEGKFGRPHAVGDHVLAVIYPEYDFGQVAVADNQTGAVTTLTATTAPDKVKNVASDGKTLAWIVQPGNDVPGWLWTSPFATTAATLKPQKRRPTPPIREQHSAAGSGYYAMYSYKYKSDGAGDGKFHVYRLADAHEWTAEFPPGVPGPNEILYVDDRFAVYWALGGLYRVHVDALGPGVPAP